jgi:2-beta-glucuronyltransferase
MEPAEAQLWHQFSPINLFNDLPVGCRHPAEINRRPLTEASLTVLASYLIISGHDFRTPRRAGIHFVAQELAKRGTVRFFSIGFSWLSYLRADPRLAIANRASGTENIRGVDCYLWKTAWHPFNLHLSWLKGLSRLLFTTYRLAVPDVFKQWVETSDTIIVESGMSPIFISTIARLNPKARKIYIVSDLLSTIGVDQFVAHELESYFSVFQTVIVKSRRMVRSLPDHANIRYVPQGIEQDLSAADTSPYNDGIHAVSVGSMLFDRSFFDLAASAFPNITFHVIGGGRHAARLDHPNVKIYGEMPFRDTLRYLKNAHFGIAPYEAERVEDYLCDTSLKLIQYASFGVPAVCPNLVVGDYAGRFGYTPGDIASIVQAIERALSAGKFTPTKILSWAEVVDRIISPNDYSDTRIPLLSSAR